METSISVCIPTYNGAPYIQEQLRSILSQLNDNSEIIISDDHSADATLQKISALNDSRIKIFTNEGISGPVNNMENALKRAKGDFIFLADQDDIWYPEKISVTMPLLEKYDLVVSDATIIDKSGKIQHPSFFMANKSGRGLLRNWYRNSFMGCCMAFNRKLLDYTLPFAPGIAMHDMWIGLNAVMTAKYHLLPRPLVYYRRHGRNATPGHEKSGFSTAYMIKYRLHLMYHVIVRRLQYRISSSQNR